jgi:hypothetical protein
MPIVHAPLQDARVLVRNDGLVAHGPALDVAALLDQLRDLVAAPVVDVQLAGAHGDFLSSFVIQMSAVNIIYVNPDGNDERL